jgi:hypothetical protein
MFLDCEVLTRFNQLQLDTILLNAWKLNRFKISSFFFFFFSFSCLLVTLFEHFIDLGMRVFLVRVMLKVILWLFLYLFKNNVSQYQTFTYGASRTNLNWIQTYSQIALFIYDLRVTRGINSFWLFIFIWTRVLISRSKKNL